jgi:Flp pilus assembly pilin Flp
MNGFLLVFWGRDEAQDVAEYAVMLAVILAIAVATIRLVGSHAGSVFANVGSAIQ